MYFCHSSTVTLITVTRPCSESPIVLYPQRSGNFRYCVGFNKDKYEDTLSMRSRQTEVKVDRHFNLGNDFSCYGRC